MHITFAPSGILQIDGARIIHRNFSGEATKFNREGNRNFSLVIEPGTINRERDVRSAEEIRDILIDDVNKYGVGWNVKTKDPRDEGDDPFIYMQVKLKFSDKGPAVYLISGNVRRELNEESINMLDNIDIANVDLDIRPYDDVVNGKPFRAAYLHSICVTQDVDRFKARWEDEE